MKYEGQQGAAGYAPQVARPQSADVRHIKMNTPYLNPLRLFKVLGLITAVILVPVLNMLFSMGIVVHDTIYLANPELGPDGWIKYSERILDPLILWITYPLFLLLACWILACMGLIFAFKRYQKRVEQAVPGYPPQGVGSPEP